MRRSFLLLLLAACSPAAEPWVVTPEGVGPLTVGMDITVVDSILGDGFEIPAYISGCDLLPLSGERDGIWLMFRDGQLVRTEARTPVIADGEGVRVGDGEATVTARYGDRIQRAPHKWVDGFYLTIMPVAGADTLRRTVIEVEKGVVLLIRAGRMPEVEWTEGCV